MISTSSPVSLLIFEGLHVPIIHQCMYVCVCLCVCACLRVWAVGLEICELVDHQCQHTCVSSPASYRCKCREGFTLNPDGKTCKGEGSGC